MKTYTQAARRFYKSAAWRKCREAYIKKVGFCERCLATGIATPGKIVHHKIYLDDDKLQRPDISLNFDNLELLCQDCHNKEHHHGDSRRYSFDAYGNIRRH